MSTYYSVVKYFEGASGESTFTITFPYLRRDHVFVYLSEEPLSDLDPVTGEPNPPVSTTLLVRGVDYSIQNDTSVVLTDPLPPQNSLTIRRFTELDQRLASYFDASYLTETELNEVTLQFLYLLQEIEDRRLIGDGGDIVAGAPSDDGGDVPTVDDIITGITNTPLFETLTTLIPFVDFNAESIIRDAIARHEDWSLAEVREIFKDRAFEERDAAREIRDQLVDAAFEERDAARELRDQFVDAAFEARDDAQELRDQALALRDSIIDDNFLDLRQIQGANFTELLSLVEEEGMARATQITSLAAVVDSNFSAYETFTDVYVNDQQASGIRFENLESNFADNEAFVTSIWETFVDENEARASEITLLGAEFTTDLAETNASIFQLNEVVASEVEARATQINLLEVDFTNQIVDTNASIFELNSVVTTETQALATQINLLDVGFTNQIVDTNASIFELNSVVTTETQALAQQINLVETNFTNDIVDTNASIFELNSVVTTETQALAQQINLVETNFTNDIVDTNAFVVETTSALSSETQAVAQNFTSLQADFNILDTNTNSSISQFNQALSTETEARNLQFNLLDSEFNNLETNTQASIFQQNQTLADQELAFTEQINLLESNLTTANTQTNALVLDLSATVATTTDASALRFNTIEASVDDLETGQTVSQGDITELQNVQATQTSSIASLVTEVATKLTVDQLDGPVEQLIGSSSHIEGVRQSIQATDSDVLAEAQRIDSLLTRVDSYDADLNAVSTNVAISQDWASQAVTKADATATRLQMIGVAFGMDPTNQDPAIYAAAIQDTWTVDVNETIASASRFYTLQANSKPTLYSEVIPVPTDEPYVTEWADFVNETDFGIPPGFPAGTIWVREFTLAGKFYRRHYEWIPTFTSSGWGFVNPPVGVPPDEINGPDVFRVSWTYQTGLGTSATAYGRWVDTGATALGALVGRFEDADVTEGSASAILRDQIQASVDGIDASIQQRMRIDIDGSTGNAVADYSTRINVTRPGGEPVIAGFGVGVSGEPGYERSDFIVMADFFSVIAPPKNSQALYDAYGTYDGENPTVPFLVDGTNNNVYINGNLFISDTLYGYQGRLREVHLGKAVFGQMFSSANMPVDGDQASGINPSFNTLVDPDGYRFELTSSTDNFWDSDDPWSNRKYLMWAGSGTKTDNTAKFWVDSNGNAYFGGTVQAGNISGSLSNVFNEQHTNDPWSPSIGASWKNCKPTDDGWETFSISSSRLLTPVFLCNFSMVHGRAGEVQVQARYDTGGGAYTIEETIAAASWTMDRTDGAQNVSVQGALPINVNTNVQVRLRFRDPYGFPHSNAGYSILALMLPDSATASGGGTASAGTTATEGNLPDSPFALM